MCYAKRAKIASRAPNKSLIFSSFVSCRSCSNAVWFAGLLTYFLGNVIFFGALSLAPASLCAALLATVVVVNAALSRLLLKERLQRCDYHGGALICFGVF